MIGTSRTHVNLFMNKFRQLGFIEYSGDPKGDIKVNRSLLNMRKRCCQAATLSAAGT
jgi:hypothetical protein